MLTLVVWMKYKLYRCLQVQGAMDHQNKLESIICHVFFFFFFFFFFFSVTFLVKRSCTAEVFPLGILYYYVIIVGYLYINLSTHSV